VEITELPIGVWTQTVKDILVSLLNPPNSGASGSKSGGAKKKGAASAASTKRSPTKRSKVLLGITSDEPIIKDYAEYHTDTSVSFKIKFDTDILTQLLVEDEKSGITELEKILHLTSRISCDKKLNLYDENLKLKSYSCVEEILEHYYKLRLDYYGRRKDFMIPKMEAELLNLSTRVRFILDVISKKIRVNDRTKANITEQLEAADYPKMFERRLMYLKDMTEVQRNAGNYDFLVGMPIYSLTRERIEELKTEHAEMETKLNVLKSKSVADLWSDDLKEFEKELDNFMKDFYEEFDLNPEDFPSSTIKVNRTVTMKKRESTKVVKDE
jgi:DNA topoisomerase-2